MDNFKIKTLTATLFLVSLFFFVGCDNQAANDNLYPTYRWSGETMGTVYRITVVDNKGDDNVAGRVNEKSARGEGVDASHLDAKLDLAKQRVSEQLNAIIMSMSTYEAESEISVFNRLPANQCQLMSQDFLYVLELSIQVHKASGGAFNPLVGPLVERWGFGHSNAAFVYPEAKELARLLALADLSNLLVNTDTQSLCKTDDIEIDFSAVAKGYAVDKVAAELSALSISNFLVDIGGEVFVSGHNPQGDAWRLAIEKPVFRAGEIEQVVNLRDVAIATSGDYRNFFEYQGERYSHTIDVRSGYPVQHNVASVSVIAETAAIADAWATTLNVLPLEQIKQLAKAHQLAVFVITREHAQESDMSEIASWYSQQFQAYMAE
ncbi:FAD:protein FMN transferase [Pseudomonadales bacterium]|nr:FAD:protein FMN transferase [Pseudomonadales bacterium]